MSSGRGVIIGLGVIEQGYVMMKWFGLSSVLVGCINIGENQYEVNTDVEQQLVTMRIDFGQADGSLDWAPVNDTVMGGESVGVAEYTENAVLFEGVVSTENNGGFVSLRSPVAEYDLSAFTEVEIAYRAQGHNFKMVLADRVAWWMPTFEAEIITTTDEWTTTTVSLYDFQQYEMTGYGDDPTGEPMTAEMLAQTVRIDLMNTAFSDGEFELEVDYIEFRGPVDSSN